MRNGTNANSSELSSTEGANFRGGLQRQQQANSMNVLRRGCNVLLCQPKPIKATELERQGYKSTYTQSCDINSRLNRQLCFDNNSEKDDFAQELEDRIEADLEIESIFQDLPQARSLSMGKSLPERPSNPIINDKLFINEDSNSLDLMKSKLSISSMKQLPFFKNRECSIERQKRIIREDYEAQNEMHQLLLSSGEKDQDQNQNHSFDSLSCSSELSSFEGEFFEVFQSEVLLEN